MNRKIVLLICVALLAFIAIMMTWVILTSANTPEERFTKETGLPFPADAKQIVESRDYHKGFATEGSTEISFVVRQGTVDAWLAAKPPWQEAWSFDPLPFSIDDDENKDGRFASCEKGDGGDGARLWIDTRTNRVVLTYWMY